MIVRPVISSPKDPDAVNYILAAGITDKVYQRAINFITIQAKKNGYWNGAKAIYLLASGNGYSVRFNLKSPRDSVLAYRLTPSGGITYTPRGGVKSNGSTGYFDTNMAANVMSQNDYHISLYSRTDSNGTEVDMGARTGTGANLAHDCFLEIRTSGTTYYACNQGSGGVNNTISFSDSNSLGHYLGTRTGANNCAAYKAGVSKVTGVLTSDTLSIRNIYILAYNNAGTAQLFSAKQVSLVSLGASATAAQAALIAADVQQFHIMLNMQV